MRVALIDPSLFTLPYDRALAQGLGAAGHEVTLFARIPGADDNAAGGIALAPHFYRVADSAMARKLPNAARLAVKGLDHLVSMLRLRRVLERWRPGAIHFQWLALPMVDRRMLAGLRAIAPLVLTVHDTNPFNGDPSAALQARGFTRALSAFDRLIVHTQQGRSRLIAAGIDPALVAVLPHGLLFEPPPQALTDQMTDDVTFLLFGKIKPYKGLDVLIDAFAALPPALRARARLRVVGKPYMDLEPLRERAARHGVGDQLTIETRFVDDTEIPALFGPGVIAVFPYREIEASGVLSIALAYGRPVIASDLGNFSETVTDGQGVLVRPDDPQALARAMERLLADRAFTAGCAAAARASVCRIPDWTTIGRMTASVYAAAGAVMPAAPAVA